MKGAFAMVNLSSGVFKPMCILASCLFLPLILCCLTLSFINISLQIFLVALFLFLCYVVILFLIYKDSRKEDHYLHLLDNRLVIYYPNLGKASPLSIEISKIVSIEFYKISSIKAWLLLFNYVCPQCAYINYKMGEKEECKLIGYPDYIRLCELCRDNGIVLIEK